MFFSGKSHRPTRDRAGSNGHINIRARLNEAGNILLQVVVVISVLTVGIYFLSDRLITQKNVVLQTSSILHVRFALQSTMDYMYYAIQRRYCLDETLLQAPNCELSMGKNGALASSTSQLLNGNARSIERILLSKQQAANMSDMLQFSCVKLNLEPPFQPMKETPSNGLDLGPNNCSGNQYKREHPGPPTPPEQGNAPPTYTDAIRVPNLIDIVVPVKDIGTAHPLYTVIEPMNRALKQDKVLSERMKNHDLAINIHVEVKRDEAGRIPITGNEVFFTVKVTFEDQSGKMLVANRIPLRLASYGTMFPRELGSFSLLVPNGLALDGHTHRLGDVVFPTYTNWPSTGKGVMFKSPVFVNGDIHLPHVNSPLTHYTGAAAQYSPVTFADTVFIGGGWIKEQDRNYAPDTAGGKTDALWVDNRLFGGFKMGVSVDGAIDKGLAQFGAPSLLGAGTDSGLTQKCLARIGATANAQKLAKNADLYSTGSPPFSGTHFEYVMGIIDPASENTEATSIEFNAQKGPLEAITPPVGDANAWRSALRTPATATDYGVVKLKVKLGSRIAEAKMSINSTLTLTPEPATQAVLDTFKTESENPPAGATAAEKQALIDRYEALKAARNNPGSFTIKVINDSPIAGNEGSADNTQKVLTTLKIDAARPETFYDENGNLAAPSIEVLAYDARWDRYMVVNPDNDPNLTASVTKHLTRFIKFTNAAGSLTGQAELYKSLSPDVLDTDGYTPPFRNKSPKYDSFDYVKLDRLCKENSSQATGQSFGAAGWNVDFSKYVHTLRKSWNYANADGFQGQKNCLPPDEDALSPDLSKARYAECEYIFGAHNSKLAPDSITPPFNMQGREEFIPLSIVKTCVIQKEAQLVSGMFTCETLTIERRSTPLLMVGTFIVKELNVDPTAMVAGITWMSIFHPDAVPILRTAKILRPTRDPLGDCNASLSTLPIWDLTGMSVAHLSDLSSCNVSSLRSISDNIRWTTVDPDCGFIPDVTPEPTLSTCKRHPMNYFVMEHGRGGGP